MGELAELLKIVRQRVRLLVGRHLQTMLNGAKKPIRRVQFLRRCGSDPAALRQLRQSPQRAPVAQFGMPAACDQLLRLRKKLDFANAAAAKLDVVARDRDLAVSLVSMNLTLHRMDVR